MLVGVVVGTGCRSSARSGDKTPAPAEAAPAPVPTTSTPASPSTESLCRELVANHGGDAALVPRCVERTRAVPLADLEICVRAERWMRPLIGELVTARARVEMATLEEMIDGMEQCSDFAGTEELRCTAAAQDEAAAKTCLGRFIGVMLRAAMSSSTQPEVVRDLERMGALARAAYEKAGKFPVGATGATPSRSCCEMSGGLCVADDKDWAGPWRALGFLPEQATLLYQYTYDSDGRSARITGTTDLDCDGNAVTYTLEARVVGGTVKTSIRTPTSPD
jgi:hypothetical protein